MTTELVFLSHSSPFLFYFYPKNNNDYLLIILLLNSRFLYMYIFSHFCFQLGNFRLDQHELSNGVRNSELDEHGHDHRHADGNAHRHPDRTNALIRIRPPQSRLSESQNIEFTLSYLLLAYIF
jgi:hypothetical protein